MNTTIGPYEVQGVLGEGGMGVVYRAVAPASGQLVAIKTARETRGDILAAMRAEIRILSRINDPGIVRILDEGLHEGRPWYAMELLEGLTMRAWLDHIWSAHSAGYAGSSEETFDLDNMADAELRNVSRPMTRPPVAAGKLRAVLDRVCQLCAPLSILHGEGLVHRDLKPGNIFFREDGSPVLMDMGLVARLRGNVGRENLQLPGKVMGTLGYMAPEQARGETVDARADLFALGAILYEALTGVTPLASTSSSSSAIDRLLRERPQPPSALVDGVLPELDVVVMRLLEKRPADRYGHCDDVAAALAALGAVPSTADTTGRGRAYLYRPELVGRERVIKRFRPHLSASAPGAVMALVGESGVGKTFLASYLADIAAAEGRQVVGAECLPVGLSDDTSIDAPRAPLHPLSAFLRTLCDLSQDRGAGWSRRVLGDAAASLAPYEPALRSVFPDAAPAPELPAAMSRLRLLAALRATLAAFAREEGPVALVLDDLQWVDDLTLSFLHSLTPDVLVECQLTVLITSRSGEFTGQISALLGRADVIRADLTRLDPSRVGEVVGQMLAIQDPPDRLVDFLARATGGNPFFVAEYLRQAVDEGLLFRQDGRWCFEAWDGLETLETPRTLMAQVERRLASLDRRALDTLQQAAVLGREFPAAVLTRARGCPSAEVALDLAELTSRQVLRPAQQAGSFRFDHDKLREATVARAPAAQLPALHRAAAEALEEAARERGEAMPHPALAHHWKSAGEPRRAIEHLEKSGEAALAAYSNRDAIRAFSEALKLSETLEEGLGPLRHVRWRRALAEASYSIGEIADLRRYVDEALVFCGEPPLPEGTWRRRLALARQLLRVVIQRNLSSWWSTEREPHRAALIAEAARLYSTLLEQVLGNEEMTLGGYCTLRSLELASRLPPSNTLVRAYAMLSLPLSMLPTRRLSLRWSDRAVALAEEMGSPSTIATALQITSVYYQVSAEWPEMDRRLTRAIPLASGVGDHGKHAELLMIRYLGEMLRGRLVDALESAEAMGELAEELGNPQFVDWSLSFQVRTLTWLGRHREALALAKRLADSESARHINEKVMVHGVMALCAHRSGDSDRALKQAALAVDLSRSLPPVGTPATQVLSDAITVLYGLWGEALVAGSDPAVPAALAMDAAAIIKRVAFGAAAFAPEDALWSGMTAWRKGRSARAFSLWASAAEGADAIERPMVAATARYQAGRRRTGRERRALLEAAVEGFRGCGADVDARLAEAALNTENIAV